MTTNTTQKARLHHRPRLMRRWYPRPAQCSGSVTRPMNLATTAWRAERAGRADSTGRHPHRWRRASWGIAAVVTRGPAAVITNGARLLLGVAISRLRGAT